MNQTLILHRSSFIVHRSSLILRYHPFVRTYSISIALLCLGVVTAARGDGFLFNGQSAWSLGVMNACAAQVDDPSVVAFNPGGLPLMSKKSSAAAGATLAGVV